MSTIGSIALSGMNAATLRLQVSASNIANAASRGPLPGTVAVMRFPAAYAPQGVSQTTSLTGATVAVAGLVTPATIVAYDADAPYADDGLVASPNVGIVTEIIRQMMARFTYGANAHVLGADARLNGMLLDTLS